MLAKISMTISILLACAVAYLFVKTSGDKNQSIPEMPEVKVAEAFTGENGPKATVVAFVNGDSLNAKYEFIVEKSKELEGKMKAAEARVKQEYAARESEYNKSMAYAQSHPDMPENEARALEQGLQEMQQELDAIQEREVGVLQKKEVELQGILLKRVNAYLETFAKSKGIDYVFNKQNEIQVMFYGSDSYDVTSEVIAGLNAEYQSEKANAK